MNSSARQYPRALLSDPVVVILAALALGLGLLLIFGISRFDLAVEVLIASAAVVLLLLAFLPGYKTGSILLMLLMLSVPFAHFAVFLAAAQGVQATHLLGSLLIVHFAIRALMGRPVKLIDMSFWAIGLVAVACFSSLSFVNESYDHVVEFWKSAVQLFFGVLLFFAVSQMEMRTRWLVGILKGMLLLGAGVALFGAYQLLARYIGWPLGTINFTNPSLSGMTQQIQLYNLARASSIFSEPSYFGHYIIGMLALALPVVLHKPKLFGSPWIIWVILGILALGIALSQSIGAYYLLSLLLLVMFLIERGKAFARLIRWFGVIIIVGALVLMAVEFVTGFAIIETLFSRITGIVMYLQGNTSYFIQGESILQRVTTSHVALTVWQEHPILGVGLGSYSLISKGYGDYNLNGYPANTLVAILAETGVIGLTMLIGFSFSCLRGLWKIFRFAPRPGQYAEGSENGEIENTVLVARCVFYLALMVILIFHVGATLFQPSPWCYFGLAGLVTMHAKRVMSRLRPVAQD